MSSDANAAATVESSAPVVPPPFSSLTKCSTGTVVAGVCQPVGGMTPDDLAPLDGTEPETTTATTAPPPAAPVRLPSTGPELIAGELVIAVALVAVGARLSRWAR